MLICDPTTFPQYFYGFYNLTVDFRSKQLSFNGKVELMLSTVFYDLNRLNLEVMRVLNLYVGNSKRRNVRIKKELLYTFLGQNS
ncbi:hypothetical protein C6W19_12055 [Bacillus sp. RJGP41]|nr:hypothetical protein C6W19_12055 [Bacillus sp. RJGP41]